MADQPPEQSKSALKKAEKQAKMAADKAAKAAKQTTLAVGQGKKTDDIIGITTKKEEDFASWYQEVVLKAEMIEYYNEVRERANRYLVQTDPSCPDFGFLHHAPGQHVHLECHPKVVPRAHRGPGSRGNQLSHVPLCQVSREGERCDPTINLVATQGLNSPLNSPHRSR